MKKTLRFPSSFGGGITRTIYGIPGLAEYSREVEDSTGKVLRSGWYFRYVTQIVNRRKFRK